MRIFVPTLLLTAMGAGIAPAVPLRAPIVSPGCQGEACWDRGNWIVKAPLALYARPGATRPIATLRKGLRITALRGIIRTTRMGAAVLTKDVPNYKEQKLETLLKKGTRVRTVYYEGEGVYSALAPDGRRVWVSAGEFRKLRQFRADDWNLVRLPSGRTGWIKYDYERLDCSSYYDTEPKCLKLNSR